MTKLVHIDCETTGLDPDHHEICEVAWIVQEEPIKEGTTAFNINLGKLDFDPTKADPEAMEINRFYDRQADIPYVDLEKLEDDLTGATLVGMNVRFDAGFLRNLFGKELWSHRMVDLQSMAMPVFGTMAPESSNTIQNRLKKEGFDFSVESDHSAKNDVIAQFQVYNMLMNMARLPVEFSD